MVKENIITMKKIIAILMVSLMILSLFTFASCTKDETAGDDTTNDTAPTLKLGLGIYTAVSASDATEDKNGQGQATHTVAAALVDNDGKIVKAFIDCADNKVGYTADGKAVANESFKTKYEAGADYNMVAYGGAAKEWFEQADAFDAACIGKTAQEIAGLVGADGKGTADLQSAGCTIYVTGFVKAASK